MITVFLTGSSGLIGNAILNHLCSQSNCTVYATYRGRHGDIKHPRLHWIQWDMTDNVHIGQIAKIARKADAFIHCAAHIADNTHGHEIIMANCLGMHNCIQLARSLQARRFIYLSSIGVIGRPVQLPITEDHPTSPRTVYHASKLFGEHILHKEDNQILHPVSLRLSSPLGPGKIHGAIVTTFLGNAAKGSDLLIQGLGKREQNYIDIRDIVQAVAASLKQNQTGIFNIAANASIANLELAKLCIQIQNSASKIVFSKKTDMEEDDKWRISIDKAKTCLNFSPQYSIEDALRNIVLSHTIK